MATKTRQPNGRYEQMTREELYDIAQERDLEGRSQMDKDELAAQLAREDLGPDAVDLLIAQHRQIEDMFQQFEQLSSRPSQRKTDLVRDLITNLVRHSEIEEQIFYPAMAKGVPELADDIDEDLEEHHAVELLLWELDHLRPDADRFDAKVKVLIENVRHHVAEEEEQLLPRAREAMDEETRRKLGGAMHKAYQVAAERPHPLSPSTPPGNVLAGIPAALLDRVVNLVRSGIKVIRR